MAIALALALVPSVAPAFASGKPLDPGQADALVARARSDGLDGFCRSPDKDLSFRARSLCPLAREVKGCEALVAACDADPFAQKAPKEEPKFEWGSLGEVLGLLAKGLVWLLVAAVVGVILYFIVRAIERGRRDQRAAEARPARAPQVVRDVTDDALQTATDADLLLGRADEHARRGELDRAAALYLAASLRALDRRGAIRIARHRTNGEYVRSCKEPDTKPELRAIVREVDRVEFGHESATPDRIAGVAVRARAIVARAGAVAVAMAVILFLGGCSTAKLTSPTRARDPLGDDLLMALLERDGAKVSHLSSSLATLPIPKDDEVAPLLVVDPNRVPLEDETKAHLVRWVEAGGRLVLAGDVRSWPQAFEAKPVATESTGVRVKVDPNDEDDDDDHDAPSQEAYAAKVATPAAFERTHAFTLASTDTQEVYAAAWAAERGVVVGFAGDDLFTNIGIARAPNAAALVAVLRIYAQGRKIEIARPEDGILPPDNPVASLARAGLGLALWHAAAAVVVLLLAFGIRQARAKVTPPKARRAWTEHIEAAGGLYARARLAPHALAAYARFVDGRLRERMPRGMTDPAAFLALRANADPAWTADVWRRASAARSADRAEGDELATLRNLSALYAAAVKSE